MKLTEIIKQFVLQKDTDFAILINGKWGSGKTFFLKNEIDQMLRSLAYTFEDKKTAPYQMVYVSLYGAQSADDVEKRLFYAVNPKFARKGWKIATGIGSKLLQMANINFSEKDDKDLLSIFGGIPKNRVIVFDDLERLEDKTLNEVLGFINSYTEHQQLKVIVVADEQKLQQKLAENYQATKEKLIRFTYSYLPDLRDVFPAFASRYQDEDYRTFLTERKDKICTLFEKGAHINLRTLRFVLDLFAQVFASVKSDQTVQQTTRNLILDRFLYFVITYSIEMKNGVDHEWLTSLESFSLSIGTPPNISLFDLEEMGEGDNNGPVPEKTKREIFIEEFNRLFISDKSNEFEYFPFLVNYMYSGDLDRSALKTATAAMQKIITELNERPAQIALKKLNHCLLLEDDQYSPLVQEILVHVQAGEYSLELYPGIFQQLLYGANNGLDDLVIDNNTVALFKNGMDKAVKTSSYKPGYNRIPPQPQVKGYALLREISDYGKALNETILKAKDKETATKILALMQPEKFAELTELLLSEDVQANPVFQVKYITPMEFLQRFLSFSNEAKNNMLGILEQFSRRFVNYVGALESEADFFAQLFGLVDAEIVKSGTPRRLSTENLVSLKITVKSFLDRLT